MIYFTRLKFRKLNAASICFKSQEFHVLPPQAKIYYNVLVLSSASLTQHPYALKARNIVIASTGKYIKYFTRLMFRKLNAASICSKSQEFRAWPPQANI